MAAKPDEAQTFGPWPLGMNNRQPDYALPAGTLRNAVNADFDLAGFIRRRGGYSRVYQGLGVRCGFSCPAGQFFVEGQHIKQLNADNTATVMAYGMAGDTVAFEYFNGVVYFSDGAKTGKLIDSVLYPWGLDQPPAPLVYTVNGSLDEGEYLAAVTRIDSLGGEHGASEISQLVSPGARGIRFDSLPATTALRLYLSMPNGTTLFLVAEVPAGTTGYSVLVNRYDTAKPLDTKFVMPPPAGRILKIYKGRMYIADGSTLWYTEPYALDRVRVSQNFAQFPAPITIVEPVASGLWVVADKTYFYRGTAPENFVEEDKLGYGAVFGTSARAPNSEDVMWYSTRGIVVGTSGGSITNKQEANVAAESGTVGASLVRDKDGAQQFITSVKDPVVSPLAAKSFIQMEVVRKATP